MEKRTMLDLLIERGHKIPSFCGGRGTCGKCAVMIMREDGSEERALACKLEADESLVVRPLATEDDFEVLGLKQNEGDAAGDDNIENLGIAIDIGTTTIACALVNLADGSVISQRSCLNSQRELGADVMSRIGKCAEMGGYMRKLVISDILSLIDALEIDREVSRVGITGNTSMIGLLMGADITPMGRAPYSAPDILLKPISEPFESVFGATGGEHFAETTVLIPPAVSSFIGSDVLAGAVFLGFADKTGVMLLDIGTNGEIILKTETAGAVCASAAAGPAFEGGNISCGTGSVKGAINSANYNGSGFDISTIGGAEPIGICGSGVIDICAEMLEFDIMDETGYIENEVNISNNISFTQTDVRSVQLAKSAIRSAAEVLFTEAGVKSTEKLYIAGGFGNYMNIENARKIGLLPDIADIELCGNTSLAAAVRLISEEGFMRKCEDFAYNCREISLTGSLFSELFMENTLFEL